MDLFDIDLNKLPNIFSFGKPFQQPPALYLRKNKVIVAICEYHGNWDALLDSNLVVVTVDCETSDAVLLCDLKPSVVII